MHSADRRWLALPILLLLGWLVALAFKVPPTAAPAVAGPWSVCERPPWEPTPACTTAHLRDVDPQGRELWLTAKVRLAGAAAEPAAVFVSAYASSAVFWNGTLIGLNGVPSDLAGLERPGLRDAAFQIPNVAPGDHRLTIQMSSHNGLLRLRSPVTQVSVGRFERPSSAKMRDYLPALMSAGGLLIMVVIFGFLSGSRQQQRTSPYLLAASLCATGQLGAEASRAFLEYAYPMHFLRIALVLAFAVGFGFMLLAYLVRRFEAAQLAPILVAQALAAALATIFVPNFDQKTVLVLTSAISLGLLPAIRAAGRSDRGAMPVVPMLAVGLIFSLAEPYNFLDRDFFLWTAALFVLLLAEEVRRMEVDPVPTDGGAALPPAGSPAPTGIWLGTAAARRFLLPADIVRVAAADDYSEVFLVGGQSLLHPEPLHRLTERLPADLHRVHRSHAINLSHLRSFRKGPRSIVLLSDNSVAPVSRRRVATLLAAIGGGAERHPTLPSDLPAG